MKILKLEIPKLCLVTSGVLVALILSSSAVWAQEDAGEKTLESENGSVNSTQKVDAEMDAEAEPSEAVDDMAETLAGHSYHGEAFNEGPRQKAYLMGGTGNVRFPVTTENEECQKYINQGVGQLHGFWDLEAERSFRQAAALDENCAMAYWGCALATLRDRERAQGFIDYAKELRDGITEREKMFINALAKFLSDDEKDKKRRASNYLKDLEEIAIAYPDDIEAKALVAHRVWENSRAGIPVASYLAVDALLEDIFKVEPLHPAHHYTIHLWDYRKPERAVRAAARCGPSAPSIAHMWHMPGHIYSRLKRYEDAVYQQEASARVDHAHMIRDQVMPDEIFNFAHNNEWLIRNLSYLGKVHDAVALAKNMIELPQHPRYNTLDKRGGSASYGRTRLLKLLREYQLHELSVECCNSVYLEPTEKREEQIKRLRLLGSSLAALKRTEEMQSVQAELQALMETMESEQKQWNEELDSLETKKEESTESEDVGEAEVESDNDSDSSNESSDSTESNETAEDSSTEDAVIVKAAASDADTQNQGDQDGDEKGDTPKDVDVSDDETADDEGEKVKKADRSELKGKISRAKRDIKSAKKALDAIRGYELASEGDYEQAYSLLKKSGGEDVSFLGELKILGGEQESGLASIRKQVDRRKNEVIPLARLVYFLHQQGDKEEAKKQFEHLRSFTQSADLDIEIFARLEPIAEEFGFGKNWLLPPQILADVGFRPALDTLGPFRWTPPSAPSWELPGLDGNTMSNDIYQGRPTLLIFYLGHGCLHCAEQLQAFGPRVPDFRDAGIDVIAISTDDLDGLNLSVKNYGGDMPMDLVADPELKVFKKFRAFDDFEGQALHGTFLIDSRGKIRWQDISYEPFMDHEFVMREAKRLLAQESGSQTVTSESHDDAIGPQSE